MTIKIDDLKPLYENKTYMTIDRAFTVCGLIALRSLSNKQTRAEKDTANEIADAIREISKFWFNAALKTSDDDKEEDAKDDDKNISNPIAGVGSDAQFVHLTLWHGDMKITKYQTWEQAVELASALLKTAMILRSQRRRMQNK